MSNVEFINPSTLVPPTGYTHVVTVTNGKMVHIAGQVGLDATGNLVGEGDPRAQCEQVFKNLQSALEAAGATFHHVIKLNFYLTDVAHMPTYMEVGGQYINLAQPPASTVVQVASLFPPIFLLEIEAVAVVP